uniref:Uncharacterized protein n=1 Tax=Oncorhynchus mykiss TaxID=8022 RepID=A0A8K9V1V7_ONCMY
MSGRGTLPTSAEEEKINTQKTADSWKRHIIRQLKHRDKYQKAMFQDVILACMYKFFAEGLVVPTLVLVRGLQPNRSQIQCW